MMNQHRAGQVAADEAFLDGGKLRLVGLDVSTTVFSGGAVAHVFAAHP